MFLTECPKIRHKFCLMLLSKERTCQRNFLFCFCCLHYAVFKSFILIKSHKIKIICMKNYLFIVYK